MTAEKRLRASDPPAKAAPKSPQSKGKKKSTGADGAAADNAREDALSVLVKEKKRKESVAAEPAPPAKRAVGSGRRSVPQSAAISRKRHTVCTSISVIYSIIW